MYTLNTQNIYITLDELNTAGRPNRMSGRPRMPIPTNNRPDIESPITSIVESELLLTNRQQMELQIYTNLETLDMVEGHYINSRTLSRPDRPLGNAEQLPAVLEYDPIYDVIQPGPDNLGRGQQNVDGVGQRAKRSIASITKGTLAYIIHRKLADYKRKQNIISQQYTTSEISTGDIVDCSINSQKSKTHQIKTKLDMDTDNMEY